MLGQAGLDLELLLQLPDPDDQIDELVLALGPQLQVERPGLVWLRGQQLLLACARTFWS